MTITTCIVLVGVNVHFGFMRNVPDFGVWCTALANAMIPQYLWLMGIPFSYRWLSTLSIGITYTISPQWSMMPHVHAALLQWVALVVGDFVGRLWTACLFADKCSEEEMERFRASLSEARRFAHEAQRSTAQSHKHDPSQSFWSTHAPCAAGADARCNGGTRCAGRIDVLEAEPSFGRQSRADRSIEARQSPRELSCAFLRTECSGVCVAFSCPKLQARYVADVFREGQTPHFTFCNAGVLLGAAVAAVDTNARDCGILISLFFFSVLIIRTMLRTKHGNELRTALVFGRLWVLATAVLSLCYLFTDSWLSQCPASVGSIVCWASLLLMLPMQLHFAAVPSPHALATRGCTLATAALYVGCRLQQLPLFAPQLPLAELTGIDDHATANLSDDMATEMATEMTTHAKHMSGLLDASEPGSRSECAGGGAHHSVSMLVLVLALFIGELLGVSCDAFRKQQWHLRMLRREHEARETELERKRQEAQRRTDAENRAADSRLNHLVKGSIGSAVTMISHLLDDDGRDGRAEAAHALPEVHRKQLQVLTTRLREIISWCHRRQVLVQQEEGTYVSIPKALNLHETLLAKFGETGRVDIRSGDERVCVDESVLLLLIEEWLSNLRKYAVPGLTEVEARLAGPDEAAEMPGGAGGRYGSMLLLTVRSRDKPGTAALSPQECELVLRAGFKSHKATAHSDGVGVPSMLRAAVAAHGSVSLSTGKDAGGRNCTCVHIVLPACRAEISPSDDEADGAVPSAEASLHEASLDRCELSMEASKFGEASGLEACRREASERGGRLPTPPEGITGEAFAEELEPDAVDDNLLGSASTAGAASVAANEDERSRSSLLADLSSDETSPLIGRLPGAAFAKLIDRRATPSPLSRENTAAQLAANDAAQCCAGHGGVAQASGAASMVASAPAGKHERARELGAVGAALRHGASVERVGSCPARLDEKHTDKKQMCAVEAAEASSEDERGETPPQGCTCLHGATPSPLLKKEECESQEPAESAAAAAAAAAPPAPAAALPVVVGYSADIAVRTLMKSLMAMVDADVASAVLGADKHDAAAFVGVALEAKGQLHKLEAKGSARAQADIVLVDGRCGASAVMVEHLHESGFDGVIGVIGDESEDFYDLAQLPGVVWIGRGGDKARKAGMASRVLDAHDMRRQERAPMPSADLIQTAPHALCEPVADCSDRRSASPASGTSAPTADAAPAVPPAAAHAVRSLRAPPPSPSQPPVVAALDDDDLARHVLSTCLECTLGCDMRRSRAVGKTLDEQLAFVDFALGLLDADMQPVSSPLPPVDAVILDQNINLDHSPPIFGSDVAAQLRKRGFKGAVIILTGESEQKLDELRLTSLAEAVLEKGSSLPRLAQTVNMLVHSRKSVADS